MALTFVPFGAKNAIFCKFLDKLSALRIAGELSLRSLIDNFVPRVLIFKKLHILLHSKMEVQGKNGVENH